MKRLNKNITQIIKTWYTCYYLNSLYDDYQLEEKFITKMLNKTQKTSGKRKINKDLKRKRLKKIEINLNKT